MRTNSFVMDHNRRFCRDSAMSSAEIKPENRSPIRPCVTFKLGQTLTL